MATHTIHAFKAKRIAHDYTQTNIAPPERVFPLLCPVREAEWVPGWRYRLIYSVSGFNEPGCIFTTPNEDGTENTWYTIEHDPAKFVVSFVWLNPGLVSAGIRIRLEPAHFNQTLAHIRYVYTGMSPEGNKQIERYDDPWFRGRMQHWEQAINHYLKTGTKL